MKNSSQVIVACGFLAIGGLGSTAAQAQASRTWVSGVGDDANPCSRTAPCKTFAGAISKTATGGEINCLDSGGFGTLTITKSITILCDGVVGGVLASGTNGININDGGAGTARVFLRGLEINGFGTGLVGINFVSGASLVVEDVAIFGFNSGSATGIRFAPTTAAQLQVNGVTTTGNGTTGTGGGVVIQPSGGGAVRASFRNLNSNANTNAGLMLDTGSSTAASGINVNITSSIFSGNNSGIVSNGTGTFSTMIISGSSVNSNSGTGIVSSGFSSTVLVGTTTISGNGLGVGGSSALYSSGNNQLDGNPNYAAPNNGSFTAPVQPPQ
ncbi:hypothetical protein [Sphingomonas sp. KR3-1]|uniref:hypothetical protein n=1 Tax=Sphingomonas sp. KR3-1 TaxID=3156611 RepID=UPI0032B6010B